MKELLEKITAIDGIKQIADGSIETYEFWYISDGLRVKGFISSPKDCKEKVLPAIIVNRGGTGNFGNITKEYLKFLEFLTSQNYVLVCSQYRGNDGGQGKDRMGGDDIFDVINLYEILKQLPCVDVNRIGMYGASRGGMMTFEALIRVSWIRAAVVVAPLVDEFDMAIWRKDWADHQKETYGGSDAEKYRRSALSWPEHFPNTPLLIFHGLLDEKTNPKKSIELAEKLTQRGIPVETELFPDGDHLISKRTIEKTLRFFDRYLKN